MAQPPPTAMDPCQKESSLMAALDLASLHPKPHHLLLSQVHRYCLTNCVGLLKITNTLFLVPLNRTGGGAVNYKMEASERTLLLNCTARPLNKMLCHMIKLQERRRRAELQAQPNFIVVH